MSRRHSSPRPVLGRACALLVSVAALCAPALAQPSTNDTCANPIPLLLGTPVVGNNAADSFDGPAILGNVNGCNPSLFATTNRTVWYTFTPTIAGLYEFSMCASSFDTLMAIYPASAQDCAGNITALACNDDSCSTRSSFAVRLNAGATYKVRVSGRLGGSGAFALVVYGPQGAGPVPPQNDQCTTPIEFQPCSQVSATTQNATGVSSTLALCGSTVITGNDVWYTYTPTYSGQTRIDICANFDSIATVYTGDCNAFSLVPGGCSDDAVAAGCGGAGSSVVWQAVADATYFIRIAGVQHTEIVDPPGLIAPQFGPLTIALTAPPPPNDECSHAEIVSGTVFTSELHVGCASTDPSPPVCVPSDQDVWFDFIPAVTGNYRIRLCNSPDNWDSVLSVHSDCPTAADAKLLFPGVGACNDNGCGSTLSTIFTIPLSAGVSYKIRVADNATTALAKKKGDIEVDIFGACCDLDGNCFDLAQMACGAAYTFIPGRTCSPSPCNEGACCFSSLQCSVSDEPRCSLQGGRFQGERTACGVPLCSQPVACCTTTGLCTIENPDNCTSPRVIINGIAACTPSPCMGACCDGVICYPAFDCTGPNRVSAGVGTTCNPTGDNTTPCCKADYNHSGGLTVQDIFDYLGAYFASNPNADFNGGGLSVQDIFDFLAAYFTGC